MARRTTGSWDLEQPPGCSLPFLTTVKRVCPRPRDQPRAERRGGRSVSVPRASPLGSKRNRIPEDIAADSPTCPANTARPRQNRAKAGGPSCTQKESRSLRHRPPVRVADPRASPIGQSSRTGKGLGVFPAPNDPPTASARSGLPRGSIPAPLAVPQCRLLCTDTVYDHQSILSRHSAKLARNRAKPGRTAKAQRTQRKDGKEKYVLTPSPPFPLCVLRVLCAFAVLPGFNRYPSDTLRSAQDRRDA